MRSRKQKWNVQINGEAYFYESVEVFTAVFVCTRSYVEKHGFKGSLSIHVLKAV